MVCGTAHLVISGYGKGQLEGASDDHLTDLLDVTTKAAHPVQAKRVPRPNPQGRVLNVPKRSIAEPQVESFFSDLASKCIQQR
jgi:hypothetical protein